MKTIYNFRIIGIQEPEKYEDDMFIVNYVHVEDVNDGSRYVIILVDPSIYNEIRRSLLFSPFEGKIIKIEKYSNMYDHLKYKIKDFVCPYITINLQDTAFACNFFKYVYDGYYSYVDINMDYFF